MEKDKVSSSITYFEEEKLEYQYKTLRDDRRLGLKKSTIMYKIIIPYEMVVYLS